MKFFGLLTTAVLFFLTMFTSPVLAAPVKGGAEAREGRPDYVEPAGHQDISKLSLGTYAGGPELKAEELKGKVIFYDRFYLNCPTCWKSLEGAAKKLYPKYKDNPNVLFIATFADPKEKEAILGKIKDKGIPFSVYQGSSLAGLHSGFVPNKVILGPDGRFIFQWRGPENSFPYWGYDDEKVMEALIDEALASIIDVKIDASAVKALKEQADQAIAKKNLGELCAKLKTEEANKEEAEKILSAISDYYEKSLAASLKEGASHPSAVIGRLKGLKKEFAGCEYGEKLGEQIKALGSDSRFKEALELEGVLCGAQIALLKWKRVPGNPKNDKEKEAFKVGKELWLKAKANLEQALESKKENDFVDRAQSFLKNCGD